MPEVRRTRKPVAIAVICILLLILAVGVFQATRNTTNATPVEEALAASAVPSGEANALLSWYHDLLRQTLACDRSFADMTELFWSIGKGGDRKLAYARARQTEEICRGAWKSVASAQPPSGVDASDLRMSSAAIARCGKMLRVRAQAARTGMELIDANFSPRSIYKAREMLTADQGATEGCTALRDTLSPTS